MVMPLPAHLLLIISSNHMPLCSIHTMMRPLSSLVVSFWNASFQVTHCASERRHRGPRAKLKHGWVACLSARRCGPGSTCYAPNGPSASGHTSSQASQQRPSTHDDGAIVALQGLVQRQRLVRARAALAHGFELAAGGALQPQHLRMTTHTPGSISSWREVASAARSGRRPAPGH